MSHIILPFRNISIFPSYNKRLAVIVWNVIPEFKDAEFYIYKKQDGGQKWVLLNDEPVFGTTFTDNTFFSTNLTDTPMYRVTAGLGSKLYDSDQVALYDKTGRKTFGVAAKILHLKYILAKTDGIPVLYYPAIKNGKVSSKIDPYTGLRLLYTCPADTSDTSDYGSYYEGGYCPPFITFVRFMGAKNIKQNILDEGNFEESTLLVDFLPFPPVRPGDMVVDPVTDRRWSINTSIRPSHVKGIVPIGYTANMTLYPRNSSVYAVPIPNNYNDMIRAMLPEIL